MTLSEIVKALNLDVRTGESLMDGKVQGGYVSDLLSDVIAGAVEGDLWLTLQVHQNIVAVAFLNNLAGIVIVGGREPDALTIQKAIEQEVAVMCSDLSAYELAGRLYQMGVRR